MKTFKEKVIDLMKEHGLEEYSANINGDCHGKMSIIPSKPILFEEKKAIILNDIKEATEIITQQNDLISGLVHDLIKLEEGE